jgi:TonB family protein
MNRLKVKCYGASVGVHLVLVLVLVVGPAFIVSEVKDEPRTEMQLITFVPMMTTDRDAQGGGNRNAAPPPPTREVTPPVAPPRQPDPTPPEPVKPEPTKPDPVKPAPEPVKVKPPEPPPVKPERTLPKINLNLTERRTTPDTSKADAAREAARERDRQERAAREREQQIASAVSGLRNTLSGRTEVGVPGPGGGGPSYANFRQTVMTVYFNAWDPPLGIAADKAVAEASVTIARDGRVKASRITKPSGNPAVDASVRRALDRVRFVAPLPADSRDSERTVPLLFDLTAKRDNG